MTAVDSRLWLEEGQRNREHAADFVGRFYFNQDPKLLRRALTKPLDRVKYTPLTPCKKDFDFIADMMVETDVLDERIEFLEYVDPQFA